MNGDVGVFPFFTGAWVVWERVSGEWQEVEPMIVAPRQGRDFYPGHNPPYRFWTRDRNATIAAAKALALVYAREKRQGDVRNKVG
ncbi:hypothetical protein [Roseibium sp. Sym1]|uniref:hypothetical protein n=1 Tax=Roseibium sp. Sym1 TaxID=3016006 RepID=UPI0022B494DD|nr:hypothetical protein [Roseibium sp. Sym1]